MVVHKAQTLAESKHLVAEKNLFCPGIGEIDGGIAGKLQVAAICTLEVGGKTDSQSLAARCSDERQPVAVSLAWPSS